MPIYIDGYPFDLAVSGESSYTSEVTEHPVDADADLADHIRHEPPELTLECVVSDTPIGEIANDPTRQGSEGEQALISDAAWDKLHEIRDARRVVTIETPRRTYTSMAMTALSERQDVSTTGGIYFTVSFRQIRIIENKRVTVRVAVPLAKPKDNKGNKQPKPSKLVPRRVDAHDGTWFDPDINAWRYGASFNPETNQWEYFKGTPVGDYPKGLSDADYRQLIQEKRDAALIPVDKKGVPGANAGQHILLPGQF